MKTCTECHIEQTLDRYHKNKRLKSGLSSWCKACVSVYDASRSEARKELRLKTRYGITTEERDRMLEEQDGRCAICETPFVGVPHVDHDHVTGAVRGLLCFNCNSGIGSLGDNPERLLRAAKYLQLKLGG